MSRVYLKDARGQFEYESGPMSPQAAEAYAKAKQAKGYTVRIDPPLPQEPHKSAWQQVKSKWRNAFRFLAKN